MSIQATPFNQPTDLTRIPALEAFARLVRDLRAIHQQQSAERREANREVLYLGF
jgi:hypothetical protein